MGLMTISPKKSTGVASDEHYDNVVLLLHGDGENNGVVFTDNSKYAHVPVSVQNGIKTSTDITLINSRTIKTTGGNDCLKYAVLPEWLIGGADFTFELTFLSAVAQFGMFFDIGNDNDLHIFRIHIFTDNSVNVLVRTTGDEYLGSAAGVFNLNEKVSIGVNYIHATHTLKLYVNNVMVASKVLAGAVVNIANSLCTVMANGWGNFGYYSFVGYVDEIRLTQGVVRDLTIPQTLPFPDV